MPTQPSLFAESKMSTFLVKDVGHSVIATNKKQTNYFFLLPIKRFHIVHYFICLKNLHRGL